MSECRYCLGPCDDSHDASVRIHAYLKARIARILGEHVDTEPRPSKPHRQPPAIRVERPAVVARDHTPPAKQSERSAQVLALHRAGVEDCEIAKLLKLGLKGVQYHLKGRRTVKRTIREEIAEGQLFGQGAFRFVRELPGRPNGNRMIEVACVKCEASKTGILSHFNRGYRIQCKCSATARILTPEERAAVVRMKAEGATNVAIAATFGASRQNVAHTLKREAERNQAA